jgi:hypothetical protein
MEKTVNTFAMKKIDSTLLHSTRTIRLLNCDSKGSDETILVHKQCTLKIINADLELWQLETYDGVLVLGIGDPFLKSEYYVAISDLLNIKNKGAFLLWMKSVFKQYKFEKKDSLIVQIDYTSRFVRYENGNWRLFMPSGSYYMGGPERPIFPAHSSDKLFPSLGEDFHKWLDEKFDELYADK